MAKDGKKGKPATPDDVMDVGALRPLLKLTKGGKALSCAVCLSADGDGVILLAKKGSGKKARKELLDTAKEKGLELDAKSMRYGRATFDDDEGILKLVVNKEPSGSALGMKMRKRLQPAGFKEILITADPSIENEPEDDAPETAAAVATPQPDAPASAPAAAPQTEAEASVPAGAAQTDAGASAPAAAAGQSDGAAATPAAPPPADQAAGGAPAAASDPAAELKAQLSRHLARIIPQIALVGPERKAALSKRAADTAAAVQSGAAGAERQVQDLATAVEAALGQDIAAGGNGPGAGAAAKTASTIAKSQAVWRVTREAVEGKIDTLHDKMAEAYKDHGFGADLEKYFRSKVEPVLGKLDDSLIGALDEVGRASETAERRALCAKAQAIVTRYQGYLAGEELIKKLDENPFVPNLNIEKTLEASLSTLSKTLTSMTNAIG